MSQQPHAQHRGGRYALAVGALVVGVVLGILLAPILPGAARQVLPGSCTHVHNEMRQIKIDAAENDSERVSDAVVLLKDRPDCFGDHESEVLEGLRIFLEREERDS